MRYSLRQFRGRDIRKPEVEIRLYNPNDESRSMRLSMLIDSGADVSFIPKTVADILELDFSEGTARARSASGWFEKIDTKVGMKLIHKRREYDLGVVPVIVPSTDVIDGEEMPTAALFGRVPHFDTFHISFKQDRLQVVLRVC